MQVIYQNEVERKHGRRTDTMGVNICARRIGRCMERECDGGTRSRGGGIQVSRRIFYNIKEGIWWRSVKAAELRKLEQGGRMMEEFIQEFKRAARGSGYEGRPLIEEFKRGMNGGIQRKLMEAENPPTSIKQWYRRATALDRNWRESRREEERMRGKKEIIGGAPKQEQRQILPRPLVWQRRQPLPQQATMGPAPMEGIERTNAVVVRGQGQGQSAGVPPRRDPYAMEVDRGRNCFACRGFGHMARHCRNRGQRGRVGDNRRVKYGGGRIEEIFNLSDNLKEGENLELLN